MTMSAILRAATWLQHSRDLADGGGGLVWHQVENAIGDYGVDGRVFQPEARGIAITDFYVRQAGRVGARHRSLAHRGGHIYTDRAALRPKAPGSKKQIRPCATADVEHDRAHIDWSDCMRMSHASE